LAKEAGRRPTLTVLTSTIAPLRLHRDRQEVVGSYRIGATDEIIPRFGCDGLYTSTLFHYRPRLMDQIGLRLNWQVVCPTGYQKEYAPLLLLWRESPASSPETARYRNAIVVR